MSSGMTFQVEINGHMDFHGFSVGFWIAGGLKQVKILKFFAIFGELLGFPVEINGFLWIFINSRSDFG